MDEITKYINAKTNPNSSPNKKSGGKSDLANFDSFETSEKRNPSFEAVNIKQEPQSDDEEISCNICENCIRTVDCGECSVCKTKDNLKYESGKKTCILRLCVEYTNGHVYAVEKILDKRIQDGRVQYYLKWKGYPDSQNSWEPIENIYSKVLIVEYEQAQAQIRNRNTKCHHGNDDDAPGNEDDDAYDNDDDPKVFKDDSADTLTKTLGLHGQFDDLQSTSDAWNFGKSVNDGMWKAVDNIPTRSLEDGQETPTMGNHEKTKLLEHPYPKVVRESKKSQFSLEYDKKDKSLKDSFMYDNFLNIDSPPRKLGRTKKNSQNTPNDSEHFRKGDLIVSGKRRRRRKLPSKWNDYIIENLDDIITSTNTTSVSESGGCEVIKKLGKFSGPEIALSADDNHVADIAAKFKDEGDDLVSTDILNQRNKDENPSTMMADDSSEDVSSSTKWSVVGRNSPKVRKRGRPRKIGPTRHVTHSMIRGTSTYAGNFSMSSKPNLWQRTLTMKNIFRPTESLIPASRTQTTKANLNTSSSASTFTTYSGNDVSLSDAGDESIDINYSSLIDFQGSSSSADSSKKKQFDTSKFGNNQFVEMGRCATNYRGRRAGGKRRRGRPHKDEQYSHFNNTSIEKSTLSEPMVKKSSIVSHKLLEDHEIKKNCAFVAMEDGTDRQKAAVKAGAKVDVIERNVSRSQKIEKPKLMEDYGDKFLISGDNQKPNQRYASSVKKSGENKPSLEECTMDTIDDSNIVLLPNTVQLVESDLPLSEANNCGKLVGKYIFRQIFSLQDNSLQCLFCRNKYSLRHSTDLEKHYHVIHELGVHMTKAEFSEDIIFLSVPDNVEEEMSFNSACHICFTMLKTLSDVRDHYLSAHQKTVRLVMDSDVADMGKFFYCGICGYASSEFEGHHSHMKTVHKMQTYVCRYCSYCTSTSSRLRSHVKQRHLQDHPGPHLQCSMCSVYIHGKERLEKHIMFSHTVQTSTKTWSCSNCLFPYGDLHELMSHIPNCPKLHVSTDKKIGKADTIPHESVFYKCNHCCLTFTSELEIKKHIEESHNTLATHQDIMSTQPNHEGHYDVSNADSKTCFMCSMRFQSVETRLKHQHHVHMRWVDKSKQDYPLEEYPGLGLQQFEINVSDQSIQTQVFQQHSSKGITLTEMPRGDKEYHDKAQFEELMYLVENGGNPNKTASDAGQANETEMSREYRRLDESVICIDDLPDDDELATIGFPTKVGHFCHLCDKVIRSYRLYYMHMYNLHQLEKKYQCVITLCNRTFAETIAFQEHSQIHNQKSEYFCIMCNNIFNVHDEFQEHMISSNHANKCMQVHEKYYRTEPRNYRCKVCQNWFGLFTNFVKHMETETHSYKCPECSLLFVQPGTRRTHIQTVHPQVADTCEICGIWLANSKALWSHLALHNIIHECRKCHRHFFQKEQLMVHSEIHEPPTPCPWDGCNRKLATKVGLYNHLRMHKGETDFKCTVCNKCFFKKKALESHMRTHNNCTNMSINDTDKRRNTADAIPGRCSQLNMQQLEEVPNSNELVNAQSEMIQFLCTQCLCAFDYEDHFRAHICSSQTNMDANDQHFVKANGAEFGDNQIIVKSGNEKFIIRAEQLANHPEFAATLNLSNQELTGQLTRVVDETSVNAHATPSIPSSEKPNKNGMVPVSSITEFGDFGRSTAMSEETPQALGVVQGDIDGPQDSNQIVMMLSNNQGIETQQIQNPGDQSFAKSAVVRVPTADGGYQDVIIPIGSTENGNNIPIQGYSLRNEDFENGDNITVAFDPSTMQLDEGSGEGQQLIFPIGADGHIDLEGLLENASVQSETASQG